MVAPKSKPIETEAQRSRFRKTLSDAEPRSLAVLQIQSANLADDRVADIAENKELMQTLVYLNRVKTGRSGQSIGESGSTAGQKLART